MCGCSGGIVEDNGILWNMVLLRKIIVYCRERILGTCERPTDVIKFVEAFGRIFIQKKSEKVSSSEKTCKCTSLYRNADLQEIL